MVLVLGEGLAEVEGVVEVLVCLKALFALLYTLLVVVFRLTDMLQSFCNVGMYRYLND